MVETLLHSALVCIATLFKRSTKPGMGSHIQGETRVAGQACRLHEWLKDFYIEFAFQRSSSDLQINLLEWVPTPDPLFRLQDKLVGCMNG